MAPPARQRDSSEHIAHSLRNLHERIRSSLGMVSRKGNVPGASQRVATSASYSPSLIAGAFPRPNIGAHYKALFTVLFSLCVIFSVTDMLSTAVALRMGLVESNFVLLAIGRALGLDTINTLGLTKIAFITGSFWAASYGVQTKNDKMRTRALLVLSGLVVMLAIVSINNLYWVTVG